MSPVLGAQLPAHAVEQRRLAGAVGADEADALPGCHIEGDGVHGLDPAERLADTPRRLRSGSGSAIGARGRDGRAAARAPPVPPRGRRTASRTACVHLRFWYSSTPSGCCGVRQGAEREQHDGQARRADAGREDGGQDLLGHEEADARPGWHPPRSSRWSSRPARRARARCPRSSPSGRHDLLLQAVEQARRCRRWRRTGRRRRCAARWGSRRDPPSPSRSPAWPPGSGPPSPCAPGGRPRPPRRGRPSDRRNMA